MRHCAHKVSLNCSSKDWESLSTAKQKEWKGERRKKVWFPAWVWCVCMHVCVRGSRGGRSGSTFVCISSHNRKCLTASPSQWLRFCFPPPVHFFPWGVPLEDRDREDECPFVTICPWTVVRATHAPRNLPAHAPCYTVWIIIMVKSHSRCCIDIRHHAHMRDTTNSALFPF